MTIEVKNLTKVYVSGGEETVRAVDDVSFTANEGELFTLLGPSGCGKTTTLRCLAGLESVDDGEIKIKGDVVSSGDEFVQPEHRDIGFVFQSYALWPHMTASENIRYALKARDWTKDGRGERIGEVLEMIGLPDVGDRYPAELSGGQQQRIAFARAVSYEPSVLLMDEPLSNLDFKQRRRMRRSLLEMLEEIGITTVYVTHDQEEAFEISDETLVLTDGKEAQQGSPQSLYQKPDSPFVADFLGEANIFSKIDINDTEEQRKRASCTITEGKTKINAECVYRKDEALENPVAIIRPEDIQIDVRTDGATIQDKTNTWDGKIVQQLYRGSFTQNIVDIDDLQLKVKTDRPLHESGAKVPVVIDPEDINLVRGYR